MNSFKFIKEVMEYVRNETKKDDISIEIYQSGIDLRFNIFIYATKVYEKTYKCSLTIPQNTENFNEEGFKIWFKEKLDICLHNYNN
jgi:hypothetical protein